MFQKLFRVIPMLFLAGCATNKTEIKRLSPVSKAVKAPVQCQVVSVLKDSPAEKAGLRTGDVIKAVNGQVPKDASEIADLITAAPTDSKVDLVRPDGSSTQVQVKLNNNRPRLGSVCDLTGWEKSGVTSAGNESVTVFSGPYAMTASGIIDKGIVFLRVRLSNNGDRPIDVSPALFKAFESSGSQLAILSPKEVMCFLYGDKGAHLLALKKQRKDTLDDPQSLISDDMVQIDRCEPGTLGRLAKSDSQYAEANAQYLASESLWPNTFAVGTVADGLLYLRETARLPVTIVSSVQGRSLSIKLGEATGTTQEMRAAELIKFFQSQKKGDPLRLTLRKGQVFVGKFSSYDSIEERVWFDTPSGGMLNSTSYSIGYIRFAEPLEKAPSKTAPSSNDLN